MREENLFNEEYEKLVKLVDDNGLRVRLDATGYPITMTVRPDPDAEKQMALPGMDEDEEMGKEARETLTYKNSVVSLRATGGFTVATEIQKKLIKHFENLVVLRLAWFYRECSTGGE